MTTDVLIPILREKCDRLDEAGVPISASVMWPIFNRVAEQHGTTRRFGNRWIRHFFPSAGFKYRVASGGTKKAVGHARGQAPIALDVLRDGVQLAPILHHEHGRDGREALGPVAAWRNRCRTDGCASSVPLTSEISRSRRL